MEGNFSSEPRSVGHRDIKPPIVKANDNRYAQVIPLRKLAPASQPAQLRAAA